MNRIEHLDITKGIAMILVILGHTLTWEISINYFTPVNFFHIPIWFFISGLFFKCNIDFKTFLKKKIK